MGLPRFHIAPEELSGTRARFNREALEHFRARRIRVGQRISLFDGQGGEAMGLISKVDRNKAEAEIIERLPPTPEPNLKTTLTLGLCRWNRLRMAVEKATELGAYEIRLVHSERSQPALKGLKAKLERIVIESLKQCFRSRGPKIYEPMTFNASLEASAGLDLKLIFERGGRLLTDMEIKPPESVLLLVGPEGGFSRVEKEAALDSGFVSAGLSSAVLRTETAALAGLALAAALWERPLRHDF